MMDTFGDRLRSEREDRGLSIQAVAEILDVDQERLQALERNDFDAMPDEAVLRDCLEGYAECLQVDAELMIEDYVGERDRCLQRLADAIAERAVETAAVELAAETHPSPRAIPWRAVLIVGALALLAGWWVFTRDATTPTTVSPVAGEPVDPQPVSIEAPAGPAPVVPPASRLRVPEHGAGTAVTDRQLQGRSDRFTEGTQVWFWTRVQGGTRGDRIDHVWLREGVEEARITLKIGGSSWRTYSTKTLHPGATGDWAVEVRDDAGRVLARDEFACVP